MASTSSSPIAPRRASSLKVPGGPRYATRTVKAAFDGSSGAEDDRVGGRVVGRDLLAGDRLHHYFERRVGPGRRLGGERDLHGPLLTGAQRRELAGELGAREGGGD